MISNRLNVNKFSIYHVYFLGPARETSITDRLDDKEGLERLTKEFDAAENLSQSPIITYFDPPGPQPTSNAQLWGQSMMIPVVRLCPEGMWGIVRQGEDGERPGEVDSELSCTNECPRCYNGGVCSEYTGQCICAPGFNGDECAQWCQTRGSWGTECDKRCDYDNPFDFRACQKMFCLPHPFGCKCGPGWWGLNCGRGCQNQKYGASCEMDCHCSSGIGFYLLIDFLLTLDKVIFYQ